MSSEDNSSLNTLVIVLPISAGLTPGSVTSKVPKVLMVRGEQLADILSRAHKAFSLSSDIPFSSTSRNFFEI